MSAAKLAERLKVSLDELRMQVLGAQVLFGFQFQSLFQPGFGRATRVERLADAGALAALLLTYTALVLAPAQHRLVEQGQSSRRLLTVSQHCAEIALGATAVALGCIAFAVSKHVGLPHDLGIGLVCTATALLAWFGWAAGPGSSATRRNPLTANPQEHSVSDLHEKIEQMLTEARVVLPGVQALLGFQLIVVMTEEFGRLPWTCQELHLAALGLNAICMLLLIAPAAVHRLAFGGEDDPRLHRIGTVLVSVALLPLGTAIAADVYVAFWKLFGSPAVAASAALCTLALCLGCWYALPWAIRARMS